MISVPLEAIENAMAAMKCSQSALTEAILPSPLYKIRPQVVNVLERMASAMTHFKTAADEHKTQCERLEGSSLATLIALVSELEFRKNYPLRNSINAAQKEYSPEDIKRIIDCAERLVLGADFRLGGRLNDNCHSSQIPSNAISQVKARHLASLRSALGITFS